MAGQVRTELGNGVPVASAEDPQVLQEPAGKSFAASSHRAPPLSSPGGGKSRSSLFICACPLGKRRAEGTILEQAGEEPSLCREHSWLSPGCPSCAIT